MKKFLKTVMIVSALLTGGMVANAQVSVSSPDTIKGGNYRATAAKTTAKKQKQKQNQVPISFSGQIGYASPQGKFFKNEDGEKMAKFGLGLDFDVLYHLEQMDYKLGVGLTYNTSILMGADLEGLDIGVYGLSLYGVKGQYRFSNRKVAPYAALSLGLSQFSTPEVTMGETVVAESESAFGFGIRPEIGVELGVFVVSVGYTVPMTYKIADVSGSAGSWQISIGARIGLFDRD